MVSSHLFRSLLCFFSLFSVTASCTSVFHYHVSSFFPTLPEVTPSTSFATGLPHFYTCLLPKQFLLYQLFFHCSSLNFSLCSSSFNFSPTGSFESFLSLSSLGLHFHLTHHQLMLFCNRFLRKHFAVLDIFVGQSSSTECNPLVCSILH